MALLPVLLVLVLLRLGPAEEQVAVVVAAEYQGGIGSMRWFGSREMAGIGVSVRPCTLGSCIRSSCLACLKAAADGPLWI